MAIPAIVQNLIVQTANGENLASWDLSAGATSYVVQRTLDKVTWDIVATVTGSPLATSYLDPSPTLGTAYAYRVNATNSDGSSSYTLGSDYIVPTITGEMSLGAIRLSAQQTADLVKSNFVTKTEWNNFIRLAMYELYDLLITTYEDYSVSIPIQFTTNGNTFMYQLPNGVETFQNALDLSQTVVAKPIYKLLGVDLQAQNANNGYVSIPNFNFINRNDFVYPNSSSTIYGVFNMRYREMGDKLMFIPTPSANQGIRLWYIPRLTELLADNDVSDIGISGWIRYVIVRAGIYALNKEESDTSVLMAELAYLKQRIEESAVNRDAGRPQTISDTRSGSGYWGSGDSGGGSSRGGF